MVEIQFSEDVQFPFLFVKFRLQLLIGQYPEGKAGPEKQFVGIQRTVPSACSNEGQSLFGQPVVSYSSIKCQHIVSSFFHQAVSFSSRSILVAFEIHAATWFGGAP